MSQESKTKIGYKITSLQNTSYLQYMNEFTRNYVLGEWVHTLDKNLPLFVFDTLEHAKDFIEKEMEQAHIYECEYVPSMITLQRQRGLCETLSRFVEQMSLPLEERTLKDYKEMWPDGTLFAESVKLTKLIESQTKDFY